MPYRAQQSLLEEEALGEVAQRLVSSFLPEMASAELATLVRAHHHRAHAPTVAASLKPHVWTFTGVCLRVDMVAMLGEMERALDLGNDALTSFRDNLACNFAGSLMRKVYSWGGDVVKFVGTSFFCVFLPATALDAPPQAAGSGVWMAQASSSSVPAGSAALSLQPQPHALRKACDAALQCAWELKDTVAGEVGAPYLFLSSLYLILI